MANSLCDLSDLAAFPAVERIDPAHLDMAVAEIRAEAGWHIAPAELQTITVFSDGQRWLRLPSQRVVSVSSVVDANAATYTDWELQPGPALVRRFLPWPRGQITVTLTHGLPACPADLLHEIANRAKMLPKMRDPSIQSQSADNVALTYFAAQNRAASPAVRRYSLAGIA